MKREIKDYRKRNLKKLKQKRKENSTAQQEHYDTQWINNKNRSTNNEINTIFSM